jgi:hypothetical protein
VSYRPGQVVTSVHCFVNNWWYVLEQYMNLHVKAIAQLPRDRPESTAAA